MTNKAHNSTQPLQIYIYHSISIQNALENYQEL